jgi:hypothetical protein
MKSLVFAGVLAGLGVLAGSTFGAGYIAYFTFVSTTEMKKLPPSSDSNTTAKIEYEAVRIDLDRYTDAVPHRTELVPKGLDPTAFADGKKPFVGQEYWYGMTIEVPTTWVADNSYEVVTQWHGSSSGAAVALRMDNVAGSAGLHSFPEIADRWILRIDAANPDKKIDIGPVSADIGKKIDWVFRIRWAPDSTGRLTVWRNKAKVVSYYGPTMFAEAYGPYWKFGIYKSPWKQVPTLVPTQPHRTLRFDNVRIDQWSDISRF